MKFELPNLKYAYNALEPYIDETTMTIHHSRHHATYINNLNAALEGYPELKEKSLEELLKSLDSLPSTVKLAVQNNGGGHYNHSLFWNVMTPNKGSHPNKILAEAIDKAFASFDSFKEQFSKAATTRFGSGWAFLVTDKLGNLSIISTANQDTPLSQGFIPILALDVWEHAYYLKYQNKRPDYISSWWNVVDWDYVSKLYEDR